MVKMARARRGVSKHTQVPVGIIFPSRTREGRWKSAFLPPNGERSLAGAGYLGSLNDRAREEGTSLPGKREGVPHWS